MDSFTFYIPNFYCLNDSCFILSVGVLQLRFGRVSNRVYLTSSRLMETEDSALYSTAVGNIMAIVWLRLLKNCAIVNTWKFREFSVF